MKLCLSDYPKQAFQRGHLQYATDWDGMRRIAAPDCNAAVLARQMPEISETLQVLASARWSPLQMVFEAGDDLDLIAAEIDFHLDLQTPDAFAFYSDISWIVGGFLAATGARRIGLRLEAIDFDNCANFHIDQVHLRLVSTYLGPATEWLANDDVIRTGLHRRDNSQVLRRGAVVRRFEPGWIAIMKGEAFPGNLGHGFVHRSPPISSTGDRRLLLRIDALS